ncbi:UNVERIFIED_CONTAM: hypothetical protein Slati_0384400 [Sesamum latifolium]|uniref:Uncharacterized protein n=1 Tax=Sesamum latifolium TaxID=2727402 RepID=A0AAW2XTW7_9LAMI
MRPGEGSSASWRRDPPAVGGPPRNGFKGRHETGDGCENRAKDRVRRQRPDAAKDAVKESVQPGNAAEA